MRTLLCCFTSFLSLLSAKVNAQMILTANAFENSLTTEANDWKTAYSANASPSMYIYPNPVTDYLIISMPYMNTLPISVGMYDASGKLAYKQVLEPGLSCYAIDMRPHANGTYFLKVRTNEVQMVRRLVLLTK